MGLAKKLMLFGYNCMITYTCHKLVLEYYMFFIV